ncbi:MAG TPA: hypothetical protein V6D08_08285 [Candidatus Obscuribacterales bacterium]
MDSILSIVGLTLACVVLIWLAFPNLLIPAGKPRKKTVGSTYWGVYEGLPPEEPESARTIELDEPSGKERVVAGSAMYAAGRGTSFRQ